MLCPLNPQLPSPHSSVPREKGSPSGWGHHLERCHGKRGREDKIATLERKNPLQRNGCGHSVKGSRRPEPSKGGSPLPPWQPWWLCLGPTSFPSLKVAEQGDQKALPAGQEGGWRLVCANPGPEVFRGTWGTSRRGRQSCTADELISRHPHPPTRRKAGGPGSVATEAAEKRLSLSFLPFGTSISLSRRFSCSDTSHGS